MTVMGKCKRLGAVVLASQLVIGCGSGTTESSAKDRSINQELPPEAPQNGSRNEQIRYMRGDSDLKPSSQGEGGKSSAESRVSDPAGK